jgi:hypothetical protein
MSAKTAIRDFCMECTLNSYKEIRECPSEDCAIWKFREGLSEKGESKQKAIKAKCGDCIQTIQTKLCKEKKCPLFPYRDGHRPINPNIPKKVISAEHLEKMHKKRRLKIIQKSC